MLLQRPLPPCVNNLAERDLRWAIVTDPEGRLIGVARREELERA